MSHRLRLVLISASALVLMGCASSAMREGDCRAVRSVHLVRPFEIPRQPRVMTRANAWGIAIGGAVGGAIAASGAGGKEEATAKYLAENNIDLGEMLAEELTSQFQSQGILKFALPANADGFLKVQVGGYGIGPTAGMVSDQYRASIGVRAIITAADGRVIWETQVSDPALNGERPSATLEELYSNPRVMREQMRAVAKTSARDLVANCTN